MPQVSVQEPAFTLVRTDIAGFAGFAERGPLPEDFTGQFDPTDVAVKVTSWKQFQAVFGGFLPSGYLAYAVRGFFENGGEMCYVARVASASTRDADHGPSAASAELPAGPTVLLGTLSTVISPFQATFQLNRGAAPSAFNVVGLQTAARDFLQINQVVSVDGGTILFANPLDPRLQADSTLSLILPSLTIVAASRGSWGNRLQLQLTPLEPGAFALRVGIDLGPETSLTEVEFYRRLTLTDPEATDYALTVLDQQSNLIRMNKINAGESPLNPTWPAPFAAQRFYLGQDPGRRGHNGLSQVGVDDFVGDADNRRGLRLLEEVDEIAMLAVPDAVYRSVTAPSLSPPVIDPCQPPPKPAPVVVPDDPTGQPPALSDADTLEIQGAMIDQCERLRYRVAVLDPPDSLQIGAVQTWKGKLRPTRYAAIYYPWLQVPNAPETDGSVRRVPPSGNVAGCFAYNDLTFGVQRPPANIEMSFVTDVGQAMTDAQQGGLNDNSVNAIRSFAGRGIRVWGARSLAARQDTSWRFIHVRRLMSAIEETLERYSRWVVFRNNDAALRSSLKHSLEVMLQGIWEKGGLNGGTPAQAFFVKCDDTNNPQTVIDAGQLVCQIGVAIAAPMEFIVFEIRQAAAGSQVEEN